MLRARAFQPRVPDPLETRAVPSQVYFSPQTGIILPPVATASAHARAFTETVHPVHHASHAVKVVAHPTRVVHPFRK